MEGSDLGLVVGDGICVVGLLAATINSINCGRKAL